MKTPDGNFYKFFTGAIMLFSPIVHVDVNKHACRYLKIYVKILEDFKFEKVIKVNYKNVQPFLAFLKE